MPNLAQFLTKHKFTLTLLACLATFAVLSNSYWSRLADDWRQWLGFSPRGLLEFDWHRMLTCLVLTAGEWKFAASFLMLGLSVGMAESWFGTRQTIKLFFSSHLFVLLMLSLVILTAERSGWSWASLMSGSRDVGPSAGYYGCLGAVIAMLRRWRGGLKASVFAVLLARFCVSVSQLPENPSVVSADLAHLSALPLGWLLVERGFIRPLDSSPPSSRQPEPIESPT